MPPKGYKKPEVPPPPKPMPIMLEKENRAPIKPMFNPPKCASCKFYDEKSFICRWLPKSTTAFYPIRPDDWCGQHKEK